MKETGSTFALLVCAVSIASGCRLGDAARSADSHAGTWVMREFMISHWGFPKDEERLQQFLADSFNTVIAVPDELPYCREHGLKALLAEAGDRAAEFVDDPVVWGFFVLDEPTRKNIPYDAVAPKVVEIARSGTAAALGCHFAGVRVHAIYARALAPPLP